jgi:hypothetical protein
MNETRFQDQFKRLAYGGFRWLRQAFKQGCQICIETIYQNGEQNIPKNNYVTK